MFQRVWSPLQSFWDPADFTHYSDYCSVALCSMTFFWSLNQSVSVFIHSFSPPKLGLEPRVLDMLGKCSTAELRLQPFLPLIIQGIWSIEASTSAPHCVCSCSIACVWCCDSVLYFLDSILYVSVPVLTLLLSLLWCPLLGQSFSFLSHFNYICIILFLQMLS